MLQLTYDTESNGFAYEATKVHCICLKEAGKDIETYLDGSFPRAGNIQEGLARLASADVLICHNQIGHDLPLLERLHDWVPRKEVEIIDTMVLSRLFNPDRKVPLNAPPSCTAHGLESWGYRVGRGKVDHEDWDVLSAAMLRRCHEDVGINEITYFALQAESAGTDWSHAIEIESEVLRIIGQQERDGVNFDKPLAEELIKELEDAINRIDEALLPNLPKNCKSYNKAVMEPFKNAGDLKKIAWSWYGDTNVCPVNGPFTRIEWHDMNLGSMAQVKEYLLTKAGWKPTEWNYNDERERTSPKLTEDSFDSIDGNIGRAIKDRYLFGHRKSQIQGWLGRLRPDGRLSAAAVTCGTNTRRFRHINVVNVPKAKAYVYLGIKMRSLFTADEGEWLVGHDASGLELRMLAHYMGDPKFTEAVINGREEDGTDIHTYNQRLAGLPSRDDAKTFIYALLYGAGDDKLGRIIGGTGTDGAKLRRRFLRGLPALDRLIKLVKRRSKKGYLTAIDQSRIFMRRNAQGEVMAHKALNTLLQAGGAILMKESMVILDRERRFYCPRTKKVIDMHDEAQASVPDDEVEKYMELACWSVVQAGINLNMNLPFAAEAKKGRNWAETH